MGYSALESQCNECSNHEWGSYKNPVNRMIFINHPDDLNQYKGKSGGNLDHRV